MNQPPNVRYASPHRSYERDHVGTEYVNHTSPRTSLGRKIMNFFHLRPSRRPQPFMSVDYSSPPVIDSYAGYVPRAGQVDPVSFAGPAYHTYHDSYGNGMAHTVSAESEDVSSSPYPANILNAPRMRPLPLPWTVPGTWRAFKRIELTCPINSNECLLILRDCPDLTAFKLTLATVERDSSPVLSVAAENLDSLTIKLSCGTERLFESLFLRQLKSLHLSFVPLAPLDEPPIDIGLRSLISRSGCTLNALSLINVFLPEVELSASLDQASTVRELVVRNDRSCRGMENGRIISEHIINGLARMGQDRMCSELTTLELSPCISRDGLLAAMVASRLPPHSRRLNFNFTYSFLDPWEHPHDIQYLAGVDPNFREVRLAGMIMIHGLS